MKVAIEEALRAVADIERSGQLNVATVRALMAAMDVALMRRDEAEVEKVRGDLVAALEAGVDLKIKNSRLLQELEARLS